MKQPKKRTIRVLCLLLALICFCLSFFGCTKDPAVTSDPSGNSKTEETPIDASGLILFDGTAVRATVIYARGSYIENVRTALTDGLRDLLGYYPTVKADTEISADSASVEILLGSTNRPESKRPADLTDADAWYSISVAGNKLVINGSGEYWLKKGVEQFLSDCRLTDGKLICQTEYNQKLCRKNWRNGRWLLEELPFYEQSAFHYSQEAYQCGPSAFNNTTGAAKMMIVSNTPETEYLAYVEKLKSFGFTQENSSSIEQNFFTTFSDGENRVYLEYNKSRQVCNVILDNTSASVKEFSVTDPSKNVVPTQFWLYGLDMNPLNDPESGTEGYPNNGMLLVIRLADNSVMIIDGGNESQMAGSTTGLPAESTPMFRFDRFLHEITGTPTGEKVRIACWFVTHAHGDHVGGFNAFLSKYSSNYTVERLAMNLTNLKDSVISPVIRVGALAKRTNPDVMEMKLHTGQKIVLPGLTMTVLCTHEDQVGVSSATSSITVFNDSCTVVKLETEGMSMMVLGDSDTGVQTAIRKNFTVTTLKSDIVQVAHHGFNPLGNLYPLIQAPIAVYPQSSGYMKRDVELADINKRTVIRQVSAYATAENTYYAGNYAHTVGFEVSGGKIVTVRPAGLGTD